ncbi:hypothetical protein HID58_092153 [Brassica napus]|uniref:Uncharacterized protein n=1 Tax=Brassica napus TaxID=3708 RepID=A0ABQ7WXB9_BRANA|nr:hypothetical protein HID58_092153 [Brassica napus]
MGMERRLQTNINMAKQALSEALSLDKKTIIITSNHTPQTSLASHQFYLTIVMIHPLLLPLLQQQPPLQATLLIYIHQGAENIARLLQDFMKDTPKPLTLTSSSPISETGPLASAASEEETQNLTQETNFFHDQESKPAITMDHDFGSLSLLEKWLFDENMVGMSLEGQEAIF